VNPLVLLSLLKNPWVLLIIACTLGIGGTGWYRMKWLGEVSGRQEAIIEAQKKADDLANELIIAQAAAFAVTEKTVTVFKDRIIHAPTTSTCGPTVRDAARGVLETLRGPADPQRGALAPVH
jgi:hypothetical protein